MSGPLIDAKRHVLTLSLPAYAVPVEGDLGRLAQVVTNLLNNSAKYSEDGGRIELSVEAIGDWAVSARVRRGHRDRAGDILPRIFDMFVRAKSAASRGEGGLGIGLALVRDVVELHGGCVQASSAGLGRGTELVVRLPLLRNMPDGNCRGRGWEIAGGVFAPRGESFSSTTTRMRRTAWRCCCDLPATR